MKLNCTKMTIKVKYLQFTGMLSYINCGTLYTLEALNKVFYKPGKGGIVMTL